MNKKFEQKCDNWLKRVCTRCHQFAIEPGNNLDFYVFQSPVKPNPKMLFIGANPGGYTPYDKLLAENNWTEKPWERLINVKTNGYIANRSNPKWGAIAETMCSIFHDDDFFKADFEFNSVLMNIYYFNTTTIERFNQIPQRSEIKQYCVELTKILIDTIIVPEIIIALGNDAFNNLNQDKKTLCSLETEWGKPLMKIGRYNSFPMIWLANPSKRNQHYYTDEYKMLIRTELKNFFKILHTKIRTIMQYKSS